MIYNTLKRIFNKQISIWNKIEKNIHVLHFVGKKPWDIDKDEELIYGKLNNIWRNIYNL